MKILVTGGAGFVGSNIVNHFIKQGHKVIAFDNLSRPGGGASRNVGGLLAQYGGNNQFEFIYGDVRDWGQVIEVMRGCEIVFHTAAQTAMTTSLINPTEDFEVNALGTLNILEAARILNNQPIIFYLSTNKVYGDLTKKEIKLIEQESRWEFGKETFNGIGEDYPLDYEGPYGCSKGIGDSYCLDYARTFGLKTVVFRMSGMYGVSQYPTEDQGWVGWFLRQSIEHKPITIYGDGKQVRDILYISDLLRAFDMVLECKGDIYGQPFNLGGGRDNSISILELLSFLTKELSICPSSTQYADWRRADQKVYISNIKKATDTFGWKPVVSKEEGIGKLYQWMKEGL